MGDYSLTTQEKIIVRLISLGLTNRDIGNRIYISDLTVKTHRRNIQRKLNARNSCHMIKIAYESGLL